MYILDGEKKRFEFPVEILSSILLSILKSGWRINFFNYFYDPDIILITFFIRTDSVLRAGEKYGDCRHSRIL